MKKGFTLIELLAVIVILAIILIIAIPMIANVIEETKKSAFTSSAEMLAKTAQNEFLKNQLSGATAPITVAFDEGIITEGNITFNGEIPNSGTIKVDISGNTAYALYNGEYCVIKDYSDADSVISQKTKAECKLAGPEYVAGFTADITPLMTSNTLPTGTVVVNSKYSDGHDGYKALDDNITTNWNTQTGVTTGSLTYTFPITKKIIKYTVQATATGANLSSMPKSWVLEASNDGSTWTTLDTVVNEPVWLASEKREFFMIDNNLEFTTYRINITENYSGSYIIISEFELMEGTYSENINDKVKIYSGDLIPVMTSNSAPSGTVTRSSIYSATYDGFKAFDNNITSAWNTPSGTTTGYISYSFPSPIRIEKYTIMATYSGVDVTSSPKNWIFEGSNDGVVWTALDTRNDEINWSLSQRRAYTFNNNVAYTHYRITITANNAGSYVIINEMEMMQIVSD